jgi:hypothetical protein
MMRLDCRGGRHMPPDCLHKTYHEHRQASQGEMSEIDTPRPPDRPKGQRAGVALRLTTPRKMPRFSGTS